MKIIGLCSCFLGLNFPILLCQPVDIMVIETRTFEILDDGTQTGNWFISDQKTFDDHNHLVLERYFDGRAKKLDSYTWFFYDQEGKMKSIENYDAESEPRYLKQIFYTSSGDTSKIIEYAGGQQGVTRTAEKSFSYSPEGRLVQTKRLSPDKNLLESAKYHYKKGSKAPARITITHSTVTPYIEKVSIIYNDSTGLPRLAVKQVNQKAAGKRYTVLVFYNIKGNPIEEKYMAGNNLLKRKHYEYAADVQLEKYMEEDGNGRLIALFTINTYWHKANLTGKSYFE